jgi:hypothetical protein
MDLNGNQALDVPSTEAGALSLAVREDSEIKSSYMVALSRRRNELDVFQRLMQTCKRRSFAESAFYSFPRGGENIEGPSIGLLREAARQWGNIRTGLRLVSVDETHVHIRAFALDLETNTYAEAEDRFERLIQRKVWNQAEGRKTAQWIKPDERDLRELVNRRGSIAERNALKKILPADLIDEAFDASRRTASESGEKDLNADREATTKNLVLAFGGIGVNVDALERFLGHPLAQISGDGVARLRAAYKSIKEGQAKASDVFPPAEAAQAEPLGDRMAARAAEVSSKRNGSKAAPAKAAAEPAKDPAPTAAAKASPRTDAPPANGLSAEEQAELFEEFDEPNDPTASR